MRALEPLKANTGIKVPYIYYIAKLEQIVCLYVISLHYMGIL